MIHKKKILKRYFDAIIEGNKTFEIRKEDDCRYEVGDLIDLVEIYKDYENDLKSFLDGEPSCNVVYIPTGRKQLVEVTYRLDNKDFPEGIKNGYVVLGIKLRSDEE